MTNAEIYEEMANAVINFKPALEKEATQKAIDAGCDPVEAINEGLVKGMNVIGDKFAEHKIYLPQVLVAAKTMYTGLDMLMPLIPAGNLADSKKAVTVVVAGDVHDIGKNIVRTMLTAAGYVVTDLGKDVAPETIAGTVKDQGIDVLCMSTLMTPTMEGMKTTIDIMKEQGTRGNCTVTIGGPPTSPAFAEEIGADHRDMTAQNAVEWLKAN